MIVPQGMLGVREHFAIGGMRRRRQTHDLFVPAEAFSRVSRINPKYRSPHAMSVASVQRSRSHALPFCCYPCTSVV